MAKRYNDNGTLQGYSPFDVGFGQWANYVELGLGPERGFMKIWRHGELQIWGKDSHELEDPDVTFIPEDADLLRALADELESRATEYEQYLAEQREKEEGVHESMRPGNEGLEEDEESPTAARRPPEIVKGANVTPELQAFALK